MKTIKGNLIMKADMTFNEDLKVEGSILGKGGERFNLKIIGDLDCLDLNCKNLNCRNLDCGNLHCWNLNCRNLNCVDLDCGNLHCWNLHCWNLDCVDLDCWDLNCRNLNCWNLDCLDLTFYTVAVAYKSFKCKTWKAKRENYVIKCLDKKIEGEELK